MTLEEAIAVATAAHADQTDKAGEPYIEHPLRVAARLADPYEKMTAVLHDVVEDTAVTLNRLRELGCPGAVIAAVDALTRREGETPETYYGRMAIDPLALAVKRADIADNSDEVRLAQLPADIANRLRVKYAKAMAILGEGEITGRQV